MEAEIQTPVQVSTVMPCASLHCDVKYSRMNHRDLKLEKQIQNLLQIVQDKVTGDPSHDFSHIQRVLKNCRKLSEELDVNFKILLPAACLHDLVNLPKNHPNRSEASRQSALQAKAILESIGFTGSEIEQITQVILEHSFSAGHSPSSIESAVLQDADRLEAIGAIGVMRAVSCGGLLQASFYHLDDPFGKDRSFDDKKYTLDHFFTKLFKIPSMLNTEPAKKEALERLAFMKAFVLQLEKEI